MSDIQDAAIGFQARGRVLLRQRGVDLELRGREPELQRVRVALDVRVQDFGEDPFAHLAQEGLDLEGGVHFPEAFDHGRGLVFGEEAGDAVGDAACGGDQGVFGFVVVVAEGEEALH